jgi:LacI family transcriptional regulator, galactose operon repressor
MSTITDVARLAGVSMGTVSRVINGAENVRPDTRAKVEQAIARLGYRPNFQARSLRSKRTSTIALAIPELTNYFWTSVARGVQDASQAQGYNVFLCNTAGRQADHLETLESIMGRVDGMILTRRSESILITQNQTDSSAQSANSRRIPLVFIGQSQAAKWNVDSVYSDSISGSFALTEHLIRSGHRKLAIITGRQSSSSARDRVAGYCVALAEAGFPIDPQIIFWGEYDHKSAQRQMANLLEHNPTAIIAANNEIAIGVMYALEQRHLRVPEDIAVVCMDDFYPDSRFASIMTVAAQLPYDLGINATQLLLNRLNSDDYLRPRTVVLPTRLIIRHSCGSGEPVPFDLDTSFSRVKGQLIPALSRQKIAAHLSAISPFVQVDIPAEDIHLISAIKSQAVLLKRALRWESINSEGFAAHIEYAITNKALYRYVLEREPDCQFVNQHPMIVPEDQVEFAQRTGIAAVLCRFPGQPTIVQPENGREMSSLISFFDFPPLTDQLDFVDHYVRAVQNTSVGIAVDFRSILGDTLAAAEALDISYQHPLFEQLVEELLRYQAKVAQMICDRFSDDLTFVIFSDNMADENGLRIPIDVYEAIFRSRLQEILHPALEHDLVTVLYTPGKLEALVPFIQQLGFNAVYPAQPELNALKGQHKMSILGGIPLSLLIGGNEQAIMDKIVDAHSLAALGTSGTVGDDIPYTHFLTMLRALREFTQAIYK